MKTLLLSFFFVLALFASLCFSIDTLQSLIPGWKTNLLPNVFRYTGLLLLNIVLPICFIVKFRDRINYSLLLAYPVLVNLIYIITKVVPTNFIHRNKVDMDSYSTYIHRIIILLLAAIVIHISFYTFLLAVLLRAKFRRTDP
jgi:hypothetical protein